MRSVGFLFVVVEALRKLKSFKEESKHLGLHQFAVLEVFNDLLICLWVRLSPTERHLCALNNKVKELVKSEVLSDILNLVELGIFIWISFVGSLILENVCDNLVANLSITLFLAVSRMQVNLEQDAFVKQVWANLVVLEE